MKHCRVPGSTARCAIPSTAHALLSRPSLARHHAELAVAGGSHGFTRKSSAHRHPQHRLTPPQARQTRRSLKTSPPEDVWTTTAPLRPSIHPHSSTSPSELPVPMGEQLRHMMRLLPHSVAVCTSVSATSSPRGMTVSSLTSLSLSPPLITFHVAAPSRTLDAIKGSGLLNFHVLGGDVRGASVAHHFTGGNTRRTWSRGALGAAGLGVRGWNGVGDDELVVAGMEPPVLDGPGVMYVLRCRLFEEAGAGGGGGVIMVRDHAVVVAEVVEIIETSEKTDGHEQFGLVYADRHYRMLGDTLARKKAGGE
ncbi:hypothetical protein CONLIGDRAFT_328167 [Coniochaeta ligniaria NRRL 30616]|uniref:Flavin reductase like domain-containing protein n=1 Tax=Coniochaeta ligniaria NRRL 30616 TaxID=1408157 RepID=A0A1J7IPS6_9PEZI|nr:hypothetical protein CONLIGDRAFT_328167 [Coniochaeta ligniaria NRRL 30616]